ILSLENDAFLEACHKAYAPVGLSEPKPKVSWEGWVGPKHNWRGHDGEFHGHYLSACARMIGLSGDEQIRSKAGQLVEALARYQQPDGPIYIGAVNAKELKALFDGEPESAYLFYVIHKWLTGLYELYVYAGDEQALDIARRWTDSIARNIN